METPPPAPDEPPEPPPLLTAGPIRRALLRGAVCSVGSFAIFLFVDAVLSSGGSATAQLLLWGFLVGLIATPCAFVELLFQRRARRWRSALFAALLVSLGGYLGVAAGWVQANWTHAVIGGADMPAAVNSAQRALEMIFWDDQGQAICVCIGLPFGLACLARLRGWFLFWQGTFCLLGGLGLVALLDAHGGLRKSEILAVIAGGLGLVLPTAGWIADRIERRLWRAEPAPGA